MRTAGRFATCLALVGALVLLGSTAAAEVVGTCTYNQTTGELEYGITGGATGTTYTVTMTAEGCVGLDGTPAALTGPDDNQSISLTCNAAGGFGKVEVEICNGAICFAAFQFDFTCDAGCTIHEVHGAVPSSGGPSLAILMLVLLGSGAWLVRRRRTA